MTNAVQKLRNYQYSQDDVFITPADFRQLKALEGNISNEAITIYRGINCLTEQIRDDVVRAIQEHRFTQGALIASFSLSEDIATEFSYSEMSNFPTQAIISAQEEMESREDFLTGFGGIIVAATYHRNDVLDVGALIGSTELEYLVPTSATPIHVDFTEVMPYYRMIGESNEPLSSLVSQAVQTNDVPLIKHIGAAWSDSLSVNDTELLLEGIVRLPNNDLLPLLGKLPTKLKSHEAILSSIYSPIALMELAKTKTIDTDAVRHRMKAIVTSKLDGTEGNIRMLSLSLADYHILHEMNAITSKQMDKAITAHLMNSEHDKAIDMIAEYNYSRSDVVSNLFKQELNAHQLVVNGYLEGVRERERISNNTVVLNNNSDEHTKSTQTHSTVGGANAVFRYTSFYDDTADSPQSLGCAMIGNQKLFKLMSQYPSFSKADQIRADIILESTLSALEEIQALPDVEFPGLDKTTINTLTRYPKAPCRSQLIDSIHGRALTQVSNVLESLSHFNNDAYIRNAMVSNLERSLSKIASGMGSPSR